MAAPENNRIEYKQRLSRELDLEKEVVAFLNYSEGGFIYIGIDKFGNTSGVEDTDGDMLKIKDRIKSNISPSAMGLFDVVAEELDEKPIIKIIVASGSEKPYFKTKYGMSPKGCFLRVGSAAEPMPQAMIDRLFSTRTRNSISRIKSPRQDLRFEQLRIYYEEQDKSLNAQFRKSLELLTEDGDLNYVAYLMADSNNMSFKLAKYSGTDRVDLIENNEYGYCSIIKATKSVLDKLNVENYTTAKITSAERQEQRLWDAVALREAVINAFIHNDYSREVPPKFEIFSDRIEITSAGSLPESLSEAEFYEGFSIPRNKELMRIYRDVELVEQLGSGIPRILQSYGKSCFRFTQNFVRITFPAAVPVKNVPPPQVTPQVTPQVKRLLKHLTKEKSRDELQEVLGITDRKYFRRNYLQPALSKELIERSIPDKPQSPRQTYRLTEKGRLLAGHD